MEEVDLIIHNASQLATCAANGKVKKGISMRDVSIIENGGLAVKNGIIAAVGSSGKITKNYASQNSIDARGKVVTPGFVECHTHVVFAGDRLDEFELKITGASYLEILKNGGGIISTVLQTRTAGLPKLIEESRQRLDKILALGVTTCEVKTGYGLDTETELKMLEAIFELDKTHAVDLIPTFLAAHAVPPEFKNNSDSYVDLICGEMLPRALELFANSHFTEKYPAINARGTQSKFNRDNQDEQHKKTHHSPLTVHNFFTDVFCEKNAFNLEQSRKVLETAKSLGFKLKAHVDEFTNLGGARMAIELGAVSIDHLDKISDAEIQLLAASNTIGVVTPTVNFNFGAKEFADARKMIDAGCAIAVSTDYNPGSAPCPSLPMAMALACRYQKLLPSEALNAATINAAFAAGSGKKIGSLEVGKQADILILDTNDYRQLAYEFGANIIQTVIKRGDVILKS